MSDSHSLVRYLDKKLIAKVSIVSVSHCREFRNQSIVVINVTKTKQSKFCSQK